AAGRHGGGEALTPDRPAGDEPLTGIESQGAGPAGTMAVAPPAQNPGRSRPCRPATASLAGRSHHVPDQPPRWRTDARNVANARSSARAMRHTQAVNYENGRLLRSAQEV